MHDFPPPQPQPPRTAEARPGPVRLALRGETNLSYLDRLADRYRLGVRDLIPALLQVGGGLFKGYRTDGEVYLNAEARARISAFSRVPEEILQRALPAWTAQEPVSPAGAGAAGRFRFGSVVPAAGKAACRARPHAPDVPSPPGSICSRTPVSAHATGAGCSAPTGSTARRPAPSRSTWRSCRRWFRRTGGIWICCAIGRTPPVRSRSPMRWSSPGGHSSGPKKSSGLTGYANSRRREPIPDGGGCWPGTRSPTPSPSPRSSPTHAPGSGCSPTPADICPTHSLTCLVWSAKWRGARTAHGFPNRSPRPRPALCCSGRSTAYGPMRTQPPIGCGRCTWRTGPAPSPANCSPTATPPTNCRRQRTQRRFTWDFDTRQPRHSRPVWRMPMPTPPCTAISPLRSASGSTASRWADGCRITGNPRDAARTRRGTRGTGSVVAAAMDSAVAALLLRSPRPCPRPGRPATRTRLPHHQLRPGRMAVQPVHRLRRPAPRTAAPPGRHRPHPESARAARPAASTWPPTSSAPSPAPTPSLRPTARW